MLRRCPDRPGLTGCSPARERSERPTRKALDERAPQRIGCHFGIPSRAQFEELSQDQQAPEFIDEVRRDLSHRLAFLFGW
jgi:hypothetical protein